LGPLEYIRISMIHIMRVHVWLFGNGRWSDEHLTQLERIKARFNSYSAARRAYISVTSKPCRLLLP
jgi:hypothetical protein